MLRLSKLQPMTGTLDRFVFKKICQQPDVKVTVAVN